MKTRTSQEATFCRVSFAFAFIGLLPLAVAAIPAPGQTPAKLTAATHTTPAPKRAFEVVSIRVVDPNSKVDHNDPNNPLNQRQTFPSNRFTANYIWMISLICAAYSEIQCGHVVGGPPWLRTNEIHYDISAKVEGNAMLTREQMRPMLRTMLEERFHLKVHSEQRIVPGYALVVAKGGSKLQPNKGATKGLEFSTASEFKFQNVSTEYLARLIGWAVDEPVADKTGIQGMFDVDLKFRPPTGAFIDDPRFENLPTIFDAVQEQLGLRILPAKVVGDYIVIDHVDKIPAEN
jgi:uncharacterized protein (TIGR03435 family)